MTAITLPKKLEDWAEAEVAAGRAKSVEVLAVKAIEGYRRRMEAFRATLDAASAEAKAGDLISFEEVAALSRKLRRKTSAGTEVQIRA